MQINFNELDKTYLQLTTEGEIIKQEPEAKNWPSHIGPVGLVIERLQLEISILRIYGNKDCTAMADEALRFVAKNLSGTEANHQDQRPGQPIDNDNLRT